MSIFGRIARAGIGRTIGRRAGGHGLLGAGAGFATRSFKGAALVGGGLLAKKLWDRRRARRAGTP